MKIYLPKLTSFKMLLALVIIVVSHVGTAQEIYDPSFPEFVPGEANLEMQRYAKMHPPVPFQNHFNDDKQYQLKLDEWLSLNPFYPQLIPYHLYKGGLTPEDDILFYERAKNAWKIAHPVTFLEIKSKL